MKSFNHLFEKLIDYTNIKEALKNASKRKHARGDVRYIFEDEEKHITNIIHILENGEFKPQTHNLMKIQDGLSKKERYIMQPYFYRNQYGQAVYEQVIHHAVVQVLKPIFGRSMYFHSNGSIPKRGCHSGKKYLEKYIRENKDNGKTKYFLKGDIHHYYQSVNIDKLKSMLRRKIHDERFLAVVFTILDSNIALTKQGKINMGLPIGFYTSQWFANFYLDQFDHFIKEKLRVNFYSRYMDDFLILGGNKKELHRNMERIEQYLNNLDLDLKPNYKVALFDYMKKDGNRVGECIDFMGFKFYRDRTTLRKHVLINAKRAANLVDRAIKRNTMNWFIACKMISYIGWFKVTNTYQYYQKHIAPKAHVLVCRKVIHQHDHKCHVGYWVRETHRQNRISNIFHEQGIAKYQMLLKLKINKGEIKDGRIKLEKLRELQ